MRNVSCTTLCRQLWHRRRISRNLNLSARISRWDNYHRLADAAASAVKGPQFPHGCGNGLDGSSAESPEAGWSHASGPPLSSEQRDLRRARPDEESLARPVFPSEM